MMHGPANIIFVTCSIRFHTLAMQGWKERILVGPHIMELMDKMFWQSPSSNWENSVGSFGIGYWRLPGES